MNKREEKRPNGEPYIFIIDLDGTIIGDCNYQCDLYNIIELVKKYKMKGMNKYTALCNKYLNESYSEKSLLVRPHFFTFINAMKKMYPSSYFYIYTASEKKWANKEIAIIEKHNNFKFDRPLFTRDNCIMDKYCNIKKSVAKILPLISKTIKIPNNYDISKRLLIIDNNPTFIDYTENLLLCPSYNYMKFYDLRETLPNYNKCEELKSYISRLTKEQRIGKISKKKPENLEKTYKWLYKKCKKINKYNSKYEDDTFWKDMVALIKHYNITSYSPKIIAEIQKTITKNS
jgi:hypothetical protein